MLQLLLRTDAAQTGTLCHYNVSSCRSGQRSKGKQMQARKQVRRSGVRQRPPTLQEREQQLGWRIRQNTHRFFSLFERVRQGALHLNDACSLIYFLV